MDQGITSKGELAADLKSVMDGEVQFDTASRALYATDASNFREVPLGVVFPTNSSDVQQALEVCRHHDAAVLSRGGGTSLAGQTCNVAVVFDFSRHMNRVIDVDPEQKQARVMPGVVLDDLRRQTEPHGLTYGPDPATHDRCTLGGMLGNNACGVHAIQSEFYGPGPRTEDNLHSMEVVTYQGDRWRLGPTSSWASSGDGDSDSRADLYRKLKQLGAEYADDIRSHYPDIPRRVSGYNLTELLPENAPLNAARALVGTEGTCVTILEATVLLTPHFAHKALLVLGYGDVFSAAEHVPVLREFKPTGMEGMDDLLLDYMRRTHLHTDSIKLLPEGQGWLLVEFGGHSRAEAEEKAQEALRRIESLSRPPKSALYCDPEQQEKVWEARESGLGATAFVPGNPDSWPGWEDSAVPPHQVANYLRGFKSLLQRYNYSASVYGHFGQGCVHTRIPFELRTQDGRHKYRLFTEEAAELVVRHGGSLSGEHGDGQQRADLLPRMFGYRLMEAFQQFKSIWDPHNRMNPGKVIDADRRDQNLRLQQYPAYEPETHFSFYKDHGKFSRAAMRCVGVGKCRKEHTGTMCPSYMVTREEKHCTRGRAHLLFEMMKDDAIRSRWRSDAVKEALDLCLACKACKSECPVNVDMATYKAEFLSHYYKGRLRPREAYAFGFINKWARLGALVPGFSNWITHAPVLARLSKAVAGIAPQREIPRFAATPFRRQFRNTKLPKGAQRVILWPDTFNNYFYPETLMAAARTLADAGCDVTIPKQALCCGRPLYDYGFLDTARRYWIRILTALRDDIASGTPIVGIEPSCVAAFRDELGNFFPDNPQAQRLQRQTHSLAEFLQTRNYQPPTLQRRAIFHSHCQQAAILGKEHDIKLLRAMGLDVDVLDSGCCGMAGAFGFEHDKYEVSVAAGDRVLLPRVKEAGRDTLIVADGFSCREQIKQLSPRQAHHIAEVMDLALQQRSHERSRSKPTTGGHDEDRGNALGDRRGLHP